MRHLVEVSFSVILFSLAVPLEASDAVCVVSSEAVPGAQQPQVAVNTAGHIFIAFGADENIFVCKSVDFGITYTSPVKIGQVSNLALGMRRGPRIVTNENTVVVSAISHASGNLMAWRSGDGGETWDGPVNVNDQPKVAREGLHGMAMGTDGLIFCTWLDLRKENTQIFGASSRDGGKSWSKNHLVYASPSGTVCECCHPSVEISHDGIIHVMWRNALEGNRDMYLAKSEDAGKTFGLARKIGVGSWKLNACPMDGGDLAVSPTGSLTTVWRRNRQIFSLEMSGDKRERLLGQGEQPSVAATADRFYLIWISRRGGDLLFLPSSSNVPLQLADNAFDPMITSSFSGVGPVVVAWESGKKSETKIMASVVAN
ncbi:MAG: exo-alpha-sialidase [Planctomycetales bacterium]|nr:exo-alpha-sialidase [Planctomycetales bacterium]